MHNYMQYKPTTIMIHTNTYHDTHHANAYQYVPHYIPRYIPIQTIKSNTYQHVHITSLMIKLLGNDLWHDSESIVAKVFRQTCCKWKVMFDSHVETCSDWTGSHFSLSEFSDRWPAQWLFQLQSQLCPIPQCVLITGNVLWSRILLYLVCPRYSSWAILK